MNRNIATSIRSAGLLLALLLGPAARAMAQEVAATTCSSGWSSFGALGISGFTCDCTLNRKDAAVTWSFRGEPVISAITPGGAASGKLRAGDVIVAIDGLLITTRAAGEKVANLAEGENVVLTIRRNGRVQEVEIQTEEDCSEPTALAAPPVGPGRLAVPPAARAPRTSGPSAMAGGPATPSIATPPRADRAPRTPRSPVIAGAPATPMAPPAPESPPSAWFGFGISCHNCRVSPSEDGEVWQFTEYPTIYSVDPESPADNAGLRRGDILMKIDGADLLTADGGRRFGNIDRGQTVTWSFRRGGTTRAVRVTAIDPPGRLANLDELRSAIDRMQTERNGELNAETARLREDLLRAERESGVNGRRDLAATRALVDSLRQSQSARMAERVQELRETLARAERDRANGPPVIAGSDEQHLRFAGMVGNTNVEVRGLSSVDVSYDNETGELLIRTIDSTIRVKAPKQ
ncbi:MAG TPA: PDZ domain-containing protein [Gemmatimonadales bacterium]|nr:PDZ domain-containing protein [Gemmatimonadales bacterium]